MRFEKAVKMIAGFYAEKLSQLWLSYPILTVLFGQKRFESPA